MYCEGRDNRECDTKDLKIIPGIYSEELKEWSCHQQRGEALGVKYIWKDKGVQFGTR